jgi:peptidoglycan/LPS O-acetylase OafA/YrhL
VRTFLRVGERDNSRTVTSQNQERIEYLDWLRALAAGLVVIGHARGSLMPGGAVGVSVFFVLSGYLIASILLRDGMMSLPNIAKFIARRLARIYPLYVVQISLVVIVFALFHRDRIGAVLDALPGLLTFTHDVPEWFGYGFGVLWTLAVEFWFYVTFPFFLWVAIATGRLVPCILLGIVISIAAKVFAVGGTTLYFYDQFLVGALCAVAIKRDLVPAFLSWPKLLAVCVVAIVLIAEIPFSATRDFHWFCQSFGTALVTGIAVLAGRAQRPTVTMPFLAFLGRISYSTYLVHAVVLDVLFAIWHISPIPVIIITFFMASFTYYAIEMPVERQAHRKIRYGLA